MYLAKKARPISFHETEEVHVNAYSSAYVSRFRYKQISDEFMYMQLLADTYENGGLIDMPQT